MDSKDFNKLTIVEKELYRGVDYIKELISGLEKDYRENINFDRNEYLSLRSKAIDSYAIQVLIDVEKVLNNSELSSFIRQFLVEVEAIKKGKRI